MSDEASKASHADAGPVQRLVRPASERDALAAVVTAWESLAGGRCYRPRQIEEWLAGPMLRAIKKARRVLKATAVPPVSNDSITNYWLEHYCTTCCSLCGNRGWIDTRGTRTSAGVEVGRINYCICPNGQALRSGGADPKEFLRDTETLIYLTGLIAAKGKDEHY